MGKQSQNQVIEIQSDKVNKKGVTIAYDIPIALNTI